MDLQSAIEEERRRLAGAKMSDADAAEVALRAELASLRDARADEERKARDLDLDRREDAAREALGPKAKISQYVVKDATDDTFILVHVPAAYAAWDRAMNSQKKQDLVELRLAYVKAGIHDWNGHTDPTAMITIGGVSNPMGHALDMHLRANLALLTPIVNELGRLAGFYKEERKSSRR